VDDREQVHPETVEQWRAWLADNHDRPNGVWLVSWKRHIGKPKVEYEDAVVEALCYGWVDSTAGTLDADRSLLWFSPRRPRSAWSRPNKERVARLEAEGRMMPAGARQVELAKANGNWSLLDDVENLVVPDDLAQAFAAHPGAAEHWDAFPPSVRRAILQWIVQARRPATRAARILRTAEQAAVNERANQWVPPEKRVLPPA
jgi:uncharacterized protein YdeI (YjbR/CyaY-like superfamily)